MKTYLPRAYDNLAERMRAGKATIIYGPRQVGKTTMVENYLDVLSDETRILRVNGDHLATSEILSSRDQKLLLDWSSGYEIIFIDEAQRIPNVGLGLKILVDAKPELQLIATGSSSFDLSKQLGEPLTGRQVSLRLFPVSVYELAHTMNSYEIRQNLDDFLIYGMYPEVRTASSSEEKSLILDELVNAYLLKDILDLGDIKKPHVLTRLLTLIAHQVGSEVSINELAGQLSIDKKTVQRYLDLLEECFVVYRLGGLRRNLRNEVTKLGKYYFYDTGIRNALIRNLNPIEIRNDVGGLWENFIMTEYMKTQVYTGVSTNRYFWRTWEQQEIDLVEERDGRFHAYEIKWAPRKRKVAAPSTFMKAYPDSEFTIIDQDNFLELLKPRIAEKVRP